jgi:hypothetical protein
MTSKNPGYLVPQTEFCGAPAQLFTKHEAGTILDLYLLWLHLLVCSIYLFNNVISNSAKAENKNLFGKDVEEFTA